MHYDYSCRIKKNLYVATSKDPPTSKLNFLQDHSRLTISPHTEKTFRNLIKLTRNQIVFTIFRLIWHQTDVCLVFQINRKMVNTIWFLFNLIRFRKVFSVCRLDLLCQHLSHDRSPIEGPTYTSRYHITMFSGGLRRSSIGTPWCESS